LLSWFRRRPKKSIAYEESEQSNQTAIMVGGYISWRCAEMLSYQLGFVNTLTKWTNIAEHYVDLKEEYIDTNVKLQFVQIGGRTALHFIPIAFQIKANAYVIFLYSEWEHFLEYFDIQAKHKDFSKKLILFFLKGETFNEDFQVKTNALIEKIDTHLHSTRKQVKWKFFPCSEDGQGISKGLCWLSKELNRNLVKDTQE